MVFPTRVLLVEVKLTGHVAGRLQMEWLYKPLLEWIFKRPVVCLLVCKNITALTPGPFFGNEDEFLNSGLTYGCWHNIGAT